EISRHLSEAFAPQPLPLFVSPFTNPQVNRYELAHRLDRRGFLLCLLRVSHHVGAQLRLGEDFCRCFADASQRPGHKRPERLATLLLADGVLDKIGRLATGELSDTKPWLVFVEDLHLFGTLWNLQLTDKCVGQLGHDGSLVVERKSDASCEAIWGDLLRFLEDFTQENVATSGTYVRNCFLAAHLLTPGSA